MKLTLLAAFAALLGAQAPNVDSATLKRNKEVEASRSAAPNQPIGPARTGILTGGRPMDRGISTVELIREGYGFVPRPAADGLGVPSTVLVVDHAERPTEN
jgi:hypothetical protein